MKISKFDYFFIVAIIGIISTLYLYSYKLQLVNLNETSSEEFDGMVLFQSKFSVDDTFDNISCEAVPNKKKALVEIMEYVKKCELELFNEYNSSQSYSFSNDIRMAINCDNEEYYSATVLSYFYSHGANGISSAKSFLFDLKNFKQIQYEELFDNSKNWKYEIYKLCAEKLKTDGYEFSDIVFESIAPDNKGITVYLKEELLSPKDRKNPFVKIHYLEIEHLFSPLGKKVLESLKSHNNQ